MLAFLALSVAITTVSAQYGAANSPPAAQPSYSSNVYYPPVIYDSHYWDYGSRERHHKECPKLTTYVGSFPGIPDEAFYPPVIRYIKEGRKTTALVVCDRNVKNFNGLFARRNSSVDIRAAYFVALGTTAAFTLTCNRDERRYEGLVVDLADPDDFSKKVEVTQVTCVGLDKTPIGLEIEQGLPGLVLTIQGALEVLYTPAPGRKKREAAEEVTETPESPEVPESVVTESAPENTEAPTEVNEETTVTIVENTEVPETATEEVSQNTEGPVEVEGSTQASEPAPGSVEAIKAALKKLGEALGKLF
ncbi:hypothetical protein CAEBREN_15524 [Caenorhabditis brenneri]|uniref:Uncharacterized protein n=1 Tax=Caenorhabditis brenneri TaxID=135651 RepID=G0N8A3_CAEBE|nr:hypothetical protein CAEBREN_15524 [Caenorhabditis brenneri]